LARDDMECEITEDDDNVPDYFRRPVNLRGANMRAAILLLLLVVVVVADAAAVKAKRRAGPRRRQLGKAVPNKNWHLARDDMECEITEDDDNVLYMEFPLSDTWAYSGVAPNKRYFCVRTLDGEGIRMVLFKMVRSFQCTLRPQNDTSCMDDQDLCWFPDMSDCPDPQLRQQIIASGLCTSSASAQQIMDGMMLAINRPNWLYLGDRIESFAEQDSYVDDNYCFVWMDNDMIIVSVRIDVS